MIEAIEVVLKHWGSAVRNGVPSGGLASPAGTLMEWKGCPPRTGSGGSRILLAGAGPDYLAAEVDAVLGTIEQQDGGAVLSKLAQWRYTFEPALPVAEQVRDLQLGQGDAGLKAYTRLVKRLHHVVEAELRARHALAEYLISEAKRAGNRMRKASLQQAAAAHRGRAVEFEQTQGGQGAIATHKARKAAAGGAACDRSSGDSASVGSVAPRQAPVRINR
jgi:hypothetical protein